MSSYVTTAVFSLYETTALLTPGTASRLFRTMNGQSAQYMFFTASMTVFSAAKVVDEARTLTAKATEARSLLIGILHSRLRNRALVFITTVITGRHDGHSNGRSTVR